MPLKSFRRWAPALLLAAASACAQTGPRPEPQVATLPLVADGRSFDVVTYLYKPAGDGPFPLVIFSHGRAGSRTERLKMASPFGPGQAAYWIRKGVAVVAPVRPGYGATGGTDWENNFAIWHGSTCAGNPDFSATGNHARAVVAATYQWALQQPWVRKDRILLEGQSVGGLATVAASALNLPGVVGIVNFAGGTGGNPNDSPGKSCRPDLMAELYAGYGQQAHAPSLWLYAQNDLYWGPEVPRTWFEAYRAGDSDATLVHTDAVQGDDGHRLLYRGAAMWRPALDAFVEKVGLLRP